MKNRVFLFIVIGVAVAIGMSFAIYNESKQLERQPDMFLVTDGKQYEAEKGSHSVVKNPPYYVLFDGGSFHADTSYRQPKETVEVKRGSEIELIVTDYWKPSEVRYYLYTYARSSGALDLTEYELNKLSDYKFLVNLPPGDYQLFVTASWKKWTGGASADYYWIITVE